MANQNYFELSAVRRYFHLIAFKPEKNYQALQFLKDINAPIVKNVSYHSEFKFNVIKAQIISQIPYFNGEEDYSVSKDKKPPYAYDIFAIQMPHLDFFIVGFPFKGLAKYTLTNLINQNKLLSKGSFLKCDINKLLKENSKKDLSYDNFLCYFSMLDLTITREEKISSVNLDGDKPLESHIYKSVFFKLITKDECLLNRCAVKCRIQNSFNGIPKTQGNFHIDKFGNYKFYVHNMGKNLFTIPFLFELLSKSDKDYLKPTLINPIDRIKDE